jgi:hypothetical protein
MVSVTVLDADFFSSLLLPGLAAAGGVARSPGTTKAAPDAMQRAFGGPSPATDSYGGLLLVWGAADDALVDTRVPFREK